MSALMPILGYVNYWAAIILMMIGLYTVITRRNLIKKLIGLSLFQTAVLLLYISMGKVQGGQAPILACMPPAKCPALYSNPLPHVLMLTAIVVGVATLAVGLALIIRIKERYGTIDEQDIIQQDQP
jgi:multicomponent Na+:H+ antiporter subunit C